MSSSPRVPLGPVSVDPLGTLSETVSELLRAWSGALDPIRPGDDAIEQLAGMNDAGVVRVLDQLGAVQHDGLGKIVFAKDEQGLQRPALSKLLAHWQNAPHRSTAGPP